MNKSDLAFPFAILLCILAVAGDVMLKLASTQPSPYRSKWFALGFFIYVSTAFGWVYVMRHLKFSSIGAIESAVSILLFISIGTLHFKESLAPSEILGLLLALCSLFLLWRFQ